MVGNRIPQNCATVKLVSGYVLDNIWFTVIIMGKRGCSILNCRPSNSDGRHRFPDPKKFPKLFSLWLHLTGNKQNLTNALTEDQIFENMRVCSKHFIKEDHFLLLSNNILKNQIRPMLFLPPVDPKDSLDDLLKEVLSEANAPQTYPNVIKEEIEIVEHSVPSIDGKFHTYCKPSVFGKAPELPNLTVKNPIVRSANFLTSSGTNDDNKKEIQLLVNTLMANDRKFQNNKTSVEKPSEAPPKLALTKFLTSSGTNDNNKPEAPVKKPIVRSAKFLRSSGTNDDNKKEIQLLVNTLMANDRRFQNNKASAEKPSEAPPKLTLTKSTKFLTSSGTNDTNKPIEKPEAPIKNLTVKKPIVRSAKFLTSSGTTDLCRICLKPTLNTSIDGKSIEQTLKNLFPPFNLDLYPDPKVCPKCVIILNQTIEFQKRLSQTEKFLEQYISTTLPNGRYLDIIIMPPGLKPEDALKLLQPRYHTLKITNQSEAPPLFVNKKPKQPIPPPPIIEHSYSTPPPKPRPLIESPPIGPIDSILETKGIPWEILKKEVSEWKRTDRWGKPPYLCEKCGRVFDDLKRYQSHLAVHRKMKAKYVCDICGLTLTNVDIYQHSLKHRTKNFKCKLCWKSFLSSIGMKKHEEREHPGGVITMVQCEVCGTSMKNFSLKSHMNRTHPPVLKHECLVCNKKFALKSALKKHHETHKDTKLQCQYCNRVMKQSRGLKRHIQVYHSDKKRDYCHICMRPFWNRAKLLHHTQRYHSDSKKEHKCDLCDAVFRSKRLLQRHKLVQHEPDFTCGLCDKLVPSLVQLKRHYTKEHPGLDFVLQVE